MAFDVGGKVQSPLAGGLAEHPVRTDESPDDRGRARTKSPAEGNAVDEVNSDARRRTQDAFHRTHDEVVRTATDLAGSFSFGGDLQRGRRLDVDLVVPVKSERERVESRPEVRDGCRHSHRETGEHAQSPNSRAAASASGGTTAGFGAPAIAQSGSFNP